MFDWNWCKKTSVILDETRFFITPRSSLEDLLQPNKWRYSKPTGLLCDKMPADNPGHIKTAYEPHNTNNHPIPVQLRQNNKSNLVEGNRSKRPLRSLVLLVYFVYCRPNTLPWWHLKALTQRPLFLNVIVPKDHKFTPAENGQVFMALGILVSILWHPSYTNIQYTEHSKDTYNQW